VESFLSSYEFRNFANECLDWVINAKSDSERDIFLQITQVWLEAAARSDSAQLAVTAAGTAPDLTQQRSDTRRIVKS
jgi:hypothetical protein